MSALALLNLLNELRKSVIMRGLPSIVPLFRNKFLNSTGTQILSFYLSHGIKILKNRIYGVKHLIFCHLLRKVIMNVIRLCY